MNLLEWNESKHSVNVLNFDNDHKKIFELLNNLYNKMATGEGASIITSVLNETKDWGSKHMKAEEELMERYCYPDRDNHKKEHDFFKAKVGRFIESLNNGNKQISVESFFFLKEWFNNHILETDKKYVDFFHKKGIH